MKENGKYKIYNDDKILKTPRMRDVICGSIELAKRLVEDLEVYGESPTDPESLVAFHYPMIDFFDDSKRKSLQHSVAIGLDPAYDWTLNCNAPDPNVMMEWWDVFGRKDTQINSGLKWLDTIKLNQLCAVTVLGRAMESVNIPYIVATKLKKKDVKGYAKAIERYCPFHDKDTLVKYFDNFLFYYEL